MGAEELKKRRKSHDKYIDRQRVELATPDLFTQTPANRPRSCIASMAAGTNVSIGDSFVIEAAENRLCVPKS